MKYLNVPKLRPWERLLWTAFFDTRYFEYAFKFLYRRQELRRQKIAAAAFSEGFCLQHYKPNL
jgi:hypothetical protein